MNKEKVLYKMKVRKERFSFILFANLIKEQLYNNLKDENL